MEGWCEATGWLNDEEADLWAREEPSPVSTRRRKMVSQEKRIEEIKRSLCKKISNIVTIRREINNENFGTILDSGTWIPDKVNHAVVASLKEELYGFECQLEAFRRIYYRKVNFTIIHSSSRLESVIVPDGITGIGMHDFWGYEQLTNVVIPDTVTTIGSEAFYGCKSLTEIILSKNIVKIGLNAFAHCDLLTIYTPKGSNAWNYAIKNGIKHKEA